MVDEMISYNQGQTSYKVRVKSFKHKMNTWANGRIINLKSFKVDGVTLRMLLYPNGDKVVTKDFVSIFIENFNPFKISFVCDISLGERNEKKDEKMNIESERNLGWPTFYKHNYHAQDKDENLEIIFTVKRLYKEIQSGEEADNRSMIQSLKTVKEKTFEIDQSTMGGIG